MFWGPSGIDLMPLTPGGSTYGCPYFAKEPFWGFEINVRVDSKIFEGGEGGKGGRGGGADPSLAGVLFWRHLVYGV